jgi:putrescine transport system permease protein
MTAPAKTSLALVWLWIGLVLLLPFAIVLKISFATAQLSVPPYGPPLSLDNYAALFQDGLYLRAYLGSLRIAFVSTLIALLLGYPMAYAIARAPERWRNILLLLVILPFWTSFLIRIYAWIGLLRPTGLVNLLLEELGVIAAPLRLLNTDFAVYLGIVYAYLPFMVLPLYARLEKLDPALLEAAADLGAKPWRAFLKITLPLSLPGVIAGCLLVFIPAVGEFVIPELLGGPDTLMIGKVLWSEFFTNRDWPMSAAVAVVLLTMLVLPIMWFQAVERGQEKWKPVFRPGHAQYLRPAGCEHPAEPDK